MVAWSVSDAEVLLSEGRMEEVKLSEKKENKKQQIICFPFSLHYLLLLKHRLLQIITVQLAVHS